MRRLLVRWTVVAVCSLFAAAAFVSVEHANAGGAHCATGAITDEAGAEVEVSGFCYEPTVLRIDAGQSVGWTNRDAEPHTISGVNAAWGNYTQFGQGESISFSFPSDGVFPYFCALHPGMIGAVVVGEPAPATARSENPPPSAAVSRDVVADSPAPRQLAEAANAAAASTGPGSLLWLVPVVLASLAAGALVAVVRRR